MLRAKASAMMAQVLRNPLINKMILIGEQAPEDRQATEDVLDAMTQYGVEELRELLSSLRTSKSKCINQSYCRR